MMLPAAEAEGSHASSHESSHESSHRSGGSAAALQALTPFASPKEQLQAFKLPLSGAHSQASCGGRAPPSPPPLPPPTPPPGQQGPLRVSQRAPEPPPRHMTPQPTLVLIDGSAERAQEGLACQGTAGRAPAAAVAQRDLRAAVRLWWWELRAPLVELVQRESSLCIRAALGPTYLQLLRAAHGVSGCAWY